MEIDSDNVFLGNIGLNMSSMTSKILSKFKTNANANIFDNIKLSDQPISLLSKPNTPELSVASDGSKMFGGSDKELLPQAIVSHSTVPVMPVSQLSAKAPATSQNTAPATAPVNVIHKSNKKVKFNTNDIFDYLQFYIDVSTYVDKRLLIAVVFCVSFTAVYLGWSFMKERNLTQASHLNKKARKLNRQIG